MDSHGAKGQSLNPGADNQSLLQQILSPVPGKEMKEGGRKTNMNT